MEQNSLSAPRELIVSAKRTSPKIVLSEAAEASKEKPRMLVTGTGRFAKRPSYCYEQSFYSTVGVDINAAGISEAPTTPLSSNGSINSPLRITLIDPLGSKITAATSRG